MALEFVPAYSQFRCGPSAHAYNETAFRHFLAIDRRRAERSRYSLLLVLVSSRRENAKSEPLNEATAAAVFASLGECVREVDFIGWYREGRVPAAVLAQGSQPSIDIRDRLAQRIVQALMKRLPPHDAQRLRVRIVRLGGRVRR